MVAVVPEPPLLVPELAMGAVAETAELRAACVEAATRLAEAASEWVCVGTSDAGIGGDRYTVSAETRGSFVGFGVDVVVGLDTAGSDAPVDRAFPLPLLIAGWLAGRTGSPVRVRGELIAADASPDRCIAFGRELAAEDVGLLVVGDGAATHTERAPGHLDERAGPFDAVVAAALRDADPAALAALDPDLGAALLASGRAPWQVLAGAAEGRSWTGGLLHSSMPFGVAYHVAVWTP
jgi:hypothetical protein